MKKKLNRIITAVTTTVLMALMSFTAFAYTAPGRWEHPDSSTMIWQGDDGTVIDVGNGPTFREEHPEITDPEHFLKEYINYPGEEHGRSSTGQPKASYTEGTLELLQEFVNSFDWLNSTEAERFKALYERLGVGNYGNIYSGENPQPVSFKVLQTGRGICMNYTGEFENLAQYVGLECKHYVKSENHSGNLIKLNGYWFSTDPSREGSMYANYKTYPVDYETELNRYANEVKATDWYKEQMKTGDMQKRAEEGVITWREYWQYVYPDKSIEEIEQLIGMDMEVYEQLWK